MGSLSKLLATVFLVSMVAVPYAMSRSGWGLGTERDAAIVERVRRDCPPEYRDANGVCKKSYRSRYGRSYRGGSYGYGK